MQLFVYSTKSCSTAQEAEDTEQLHFVQSDHRDGEARQAYTTLKAFLTIYDKKLDYKFVVKGFDPNDPDDMDENTVLADAFEFEFPQQA